MYYKLSNKMFIRSYVVTSMTISALIVGKRVNEAKTPKETNTIFAAKSLDRYVATAWGMMAGALIGPFLLPIMIGKLTKDNIITSVHDKGVMFVPK